MKKKIAVIGAGSWGTALAKLLSDKGNNLLLWAHDPFVARGINVHHRNPIYLSDKDLSPLLLATADIAEAIAEAQVIISALPSHAVREVLSKTKKFIARDQIIVNATKGIEAQSGKLMEELFSEMLPQHPTRHRVFLSGPSFAEEVARGLPTSIVLAGSHQETCRSIQELLRTPFFLTFTSDDVIGVQVGGAMKNVIAIAAGISDGLSLGHNSRAAIITRGLYEMIKVGMALGANPFTFTGLSGLGDLVLTCTTDLSRNHHVGKAIGLGKTLQVARSQTRMVAEGIETAKAVKTIGEKFSITTPLCSATYRILYEGLLPKEAMNELCSLPLREELGSILNRSNIDAEGGRKK